MKTRLRIDPLPVDVGLAVVLLVTSEVAVWWGRGGVARAHPVGVAVIAAVVTAAVAVRRRYPFTVGVGVVVLSSFQIAFWGDPQLIPTSIAFFLLLYAFTVWTPTRRFVLGIGLLVAIFLASAAGPKGSLSHTVFFTVVTLVVMLLVRRVLGDRERRAQLAERERDVAAREAVVEERARIARELHDAIAHNVSMMVVQAGAERRLLDHESRSTAEVFKTIEEIGRGALTEMRRLVGMLRNGGEDELSPQPGLGDLPTLVGQVREAGLPVELTVEGERRRLPVGIELSAYRIVQEALTNALKHAGEATASVRVRYGDDTLELEIVDDGAGDAMPLASGGHGLAGMQERVALYGGRIDTGRRATGGFRVRVLLPVR
ncbi:MAG TPA: sensor histidine kinase [Gaiellaceae bacterium]|nr:sensor histidine kinase [Gaiellaceae bacterium]